MRNKRAIDELTAKAGNVQWPEPQHSNFGRFQTELREIVGNNLCNAAVSWDMEWEEHSQTFHITLTTKWTVKAEHRDYCSRPIIQVTRYFYLDPKKPIMPQMELLLKVEQEIQDNIAALVQAELI